MCGKCEEKETFDLMINVRPCTMTSQGHSVSWESGKRICQVNTMGESSSFIFTFYVKTVPVYDFRLVWVVIHPSIKEFFKTIY